MKIDRDVLEDIFVTALEGGSNYWYHIPPMSIKLIRQAVPFDQDNYLSSAMPKAILDHNVNVFINDAENEDELLGVISKSTIEPRLQKMYDDGHGEALDNHINGDGDAETADIIMQYLTMGELVFG